MVFRESTDGLRRTLCTVAQRRCCIHAAKPAGTGLGVRTEHCTRHRVCNCINNSKRAALPNHARARAARNQPRCLEMCTALGWTARSAAASSKPRNPSCVPLIARQRMRLRAIRSLFRIGSMKRKPTVFFPAQSDEWLLQTVQLKIPGTKLSSRMQVHCGCGCRDGPVPRRETLCKARTSGRKSTRYIWR